MDVTTVLIAPRVNFHPAAVRVEFVRKESQLREITNYYTSDVYEILILDPDNLED